jgi:hypothetical protein
MDSAQANTYISTLKQHGATDSAILAILRQAGWTEKEAAAALEAYYRSLTGLAVPERPRPVGGPKEAFFNLLSFVSLSIWAIAAGSLWFTLIDYWLPDALENNRYFLDPTQSLAWNLAQILVAFPVYLGVMRIVWRDLQEQPALADSLLRRWLTWLALLITASTLIGDVVVFVHHLLNGEISSRFTAKVVVVLVIAGGILWFYLRSMRAGENRAGLLRSTGRAALAPACALVLLTLSLGFARFGSPSRQRQAAFDARRSDDLASIAIALRGWPKDTPLPPVLTALPQAGELKLKDPETDAPYRYVPGAGTRYQLCAHFSTDTRSAPQEPWRGQFRHHPAGDYCFAVNGSEFVP